MVKKGLIKGLFYLWFLIFLSLYSWQINAKLLQPSLSETILFNNMPKAALLIKEQYVEPDRIDPDAMLASILEAIESRIAKLVITLPKSLEGKSKIYADKDFLEKKTEVKNDASQKEPAAKTKEQITLELGLVKKSFEFEKGRSLWGIIFLLRDIFKFIETEGNKQGLTKGGIADDPIDWEKLEYVAINAMLASLDPHSVFLEPKYARDLTLTTKGEFGGVGIVISIRDGFLTVISPIDDTPAAKAGVKAKDRIIKINDISAINMDLQDAVSLLRGEANTVVNIAVQRGNATLDFALKRAIIKVESVAYALLDEKVGYLRIKSFQGKTAHDVKAALMDLKKKSKNKMNSLIFDLRDNPGGLLREAVEVSDLFLDGGEIVSTKGPAKESKQVENATKGQLDPNLKIAVLLNGGSASASEIVGGALKYRDRAIVIGERTFGKGSVQMLFDFPTQPKTSDLAESKENQPIVEPAALKLTIAQYFAPGERTIQTQGVGPDIELHEINALKKDELSLFAPSLRETDLSAHLLGKEKREENSFITIDYLSLPEEEKDTEYGKIDLNKLNKDFSIILASELLKKAQSPNRQELLDKISDTGSKFKQQQEDAIASALKKYNIDWSKGDYKAQAKDFTIAVTKNKPTLAGDKLSVAVKIKNISSNTLSKVHGITHSKTPLFDHREFLFGRIEPGKEIEREIFFDIPKDVISRKDLFTLEIRDGQLEKISELNIPIEIIGLKRPIFSYMAYVDDSKIKPDEPIDLVVFIKNIGDGKAFEPTGLLKSELGNKIQIEKGRAQSTELLPGKETNFRFSFKMTEKIDEAKFELQLFDGQIHDVWQNKFIVHFAQKENGKAINQYLTVKSKSADIFEKISPKPRKIATLKEGTKILSIKEFDHQYLVKVDDNLLGLIDKTNVTMSEAPKAKQPMVSYEINYDHIPPKVFLSFNDGQGSTKQQNGTIKAKITQADKVKEILLYVNGKKVLFKDINNKLKEQTINHAINLKPGINVISLLARENAFFGQRGNITVYFDDANKLVLPGAQKTAQNE